MFMATVSAMALVAVFTVGQALDVIHQSVPRIAVHQMAHVVTLAASVTPALEVRLSDTLSGG